MNIQLSISLLASDRPDTLGKCLSSLTPLLKELDSELIVVFTGKDPETLELIRQYTSLILPFTWCDDFSAARNTGLREASGEWFLFIDDDEWFEDPGEIIRFFQSGEYRKYQSAYYVVRNYTDWSGKNYADANIARMCRITPETQFVNPIHEFLDPFCEPAKIFRCFAHHYGYAVKEDVKGKAPRFERNLPLLLKEYNEKPDIHNCMQLVQEYRSVNDFDAAAKYCRQGLKLASKELRIGSCELWMQVNFPLILSSQGNPEEALKEGERLLLSPRTLEVGQAHLHAITAGFCWELKEYEKGIKHVRAYHDKMRYLKNHPDKAERQNGATVTYESAKDRCMTAYVAGLLFAAELGDARQIKEFLTWIPWEDEERVSSQYQNLESWKHNYPKQRSSILEGYSRLQTENGYVILQKALYAEDMQRFTEAEDLFRSSTANCPHAFLSQLAELAVRNKFSLDPLFEKLSIESWDACATILAARTGISNMPEFTRNIQPEATGYPIYIGRLQQYFLEKQLMQNSLEIPNLLELLQEYCGVVIAEAESLYKTEILSDPDYYALPSRYKFALQMRKILDCLAGQDYSSCIPLLSKAVRALPEMSDVIKAMGSYLEEKLQAAQQPISEEFQALGTQVKQVLQGLIQTGQWQEAYGVAEQLITLLPNDLEVLKMKQEILRQM